MALGTLEVQKKTYGGVLVYLKRTIMVNAGGTVLSDFLEKAGGKQMLYYSDL